MSKHLLHRLGQLHALVFHPNFRTMDGLRRQTTERYSEKKEIAFYENSQAWHFLEAEKNILNQINQKAKQNVLVIGCGAGREFSLLPEQNLYGIDAALDLLKQCEKKFPLAKVSDSLKSFSDVHFDIIYISHHVYNHLQGQEQRLDFLKELTNLLRPQGIIYLNLDIFSFSLLNHAKFYFWSLILKCRWKKTDIVWEEGDTVRAYNGAHNPCGRIFFYHYFFDEGKVVAELSKLKKSVQKSNGFWVIQN